MSAVDHVNDAMIDKWLDLQQMAGAAQSPIEQVPFGPGTTKRQLLLTFNEPITSSTLAYYEAVLASNVKGFSWKR